MTSERRMIRLFCPSLSKVVAYVAGEDEKLDLGSIARTFGLDPWSLKLNGHFISRGRDLISSSLTWKSLLSFFSSRSLCTGLDDSHPLIVDGKLCKPGSKRVHDPADKFKDVITSSNPQIEDSSKKIKLREINSGCKNDSNIMTKCNGFSSKRKQSVGDSRQSKRMRLQTTESGAKGTLGAFPSSILNANFRCSYSENMKRMREDEAVMAPFCKRTR